ncbi:MAG: RsmD family RNA methyltransferase [Bacteroidales bacterium]|nr:RsmD family RNA methyltransferase [Bacteroidales bacterium]MBQ7984799.1 RsmD family RNA methyltransferase [Bacteroidales bacterium]
MRIVAGSLRGRRLYPPKDLPVRPTTDFAKESLFNILRNQIDFTQCNALDLFCGTGNISFEFVSRGIKNITSVDVNKKCIDFVNKTKQQFLVDNLFAMRSDVFVFLGRSKMKYDVVFADPPYDMDRTDLLVQLVVPQFLNPDGMFILEHSADRSYTDHPMFKQQRNYGKVNFTFFQ